MIVSHNLSCVHCVHIQLLQSGQLAASSSELKSNEVKGGNSANPINKNPAIRRNSTAGEILLFPSQFVVLSLVLIPSYSQQAFC